MNNYLGEAERRKLLAAGAAGGLGLAGGVFSNIKVAPAQALTGAPPEVDRLSVTVVTDSYHHLFEASGRFGEVTVQRYQRAPSEEQPRTLLAEWGLALHLESVRGADTRRVLVDFGFTGPTLNHNLDLLGVDIAQLDALLLSHGHYDHFGGMVGFLAAHKDKLRPGLPFYLGGEECFCSRETGPANAPTNFGTLDRKAIADAGLSVLMAEQPSLLVDHGFTTGSIPLASFEKPAQPSRMRIAAQTADEAPEEARDYSLVVDDFKHEHATCFNVKDKGLVVMTSCGHRGVINSVRAAIEVSGISKVHAILGGFHLMPMPRDYVRDTVAALKEFEPDYLIPMHCTGTAFYEEAKEALPERVLLSSAGTRYTFGA